MNARFLETFVWLATLKSFTLVANRLNISQPVVSSRIAALEKYLGVSLYEGSGATFRLTLAGRRILQKAETIVMLSYELKQLAAGESADSRPTKIGIVDIIAASWLPAFVRYLDEHLEQVPVDIRSGHSTELLEALRNDQLDLAFVVDTVNEPSITSHHICQYDVCWLAAPGSFNTSSEIGVLELSKLPIILSPKMGYRYHKAVEYFQTHNVYDLTRLGCLHTLDGGYSMLTCAYLAMQGLGVAALPAHPVRDMIADGRLSILSVREPMAPWNVAACHKAATTNDRVAVVLNAARHVVANYARAPGTTFFSASAHLL